jgi:putative ABC transport system permease protein
MLADLRDAWRGLRRNPFATTLAVFTLALGVGVNTAVFSMLTSTLIEPLPYRDADRLLSLEEENGAVTGRVSAWVAAEWMRQCPSIASIGLFTDGQLVMTGDGDPEVFRGLRVNAAFFDTLGVTPFLGRVFTLDDDRTNANVVVLSYELWSTRFAADPAVIGRSYTLNDTPYRIIGVLGEDFQPLRMSNAAELPRIYAPAGLYLTAPEACRGDCIALRAVARLAPGATLNGARGELAAALHRMQAEHPREFDPDPRVLVERLQDHITASLRPALWIGLGAAACVLLIACANLANLQLARASARRGEFAVRGALGAGSARIGRLMILESLLTAIGGCLAGVFIGRMSVTALVSLAPRELPRLSEVALNGRVLLIAIAAGIAAAAVAGAAPAWQAGRTDINDALKRHADRRAGGSSFRAALVLAQVALAFVLVSATGLLVRSVRALVAVDAGFNADRVLTMTPVFFGRSGMTASAMLGAKQQTIDAVAALPGVTAAGMVNDVPLSHVTPIPCEVEGVSTNGGSPPSANVFWVAGEYFAALRIPLRAGRLLRRQDSAVAPVAVVSQTFANKRFDRGNTVGRRIRLGGGPWLTIVGIVGDVRNVALDAPADEAVYQPLALNPFHYVRLIVRTSGDPASLEAPVRRAIKRIDPLVPVFHVQPMGDYLAASVAQRRFALTLMMTFGGLALLLAAIGLYGLLSYAVVQRLPELGIRAALGATAGDLIYLILGNGMALVGLGLLGGIGLGVLVLRELGSLLYGVTPFDLTTFGAATAVTATVGIIASLIPAQRAARVDPITIMRS